MEIPGQFSAEINKGYFDSPIGQFAGIPGSVGEIGGALWLTILGARAFDQRR